MHSSIPSFEPTMPPFTPELSHRWLQGREVPTTTADARGPSNVDAGTAESADDRVEAKALEELAGRVAAARSVV